MRRTRMPKVKSTALGAITERGNIHFNAEAVSEFHSGIKDIEGIVTRE